MITRFYTETKLLKKMRRSSSGTHTLYIGTLGKHRRCKMLFKYSINRLLEIVACNDN